MSGHDPQLQGSEVLHAMQHWLERAVIGLNLCPFAKAVHVKGQIHWVLSPALDAQALLDELQRELSHLASCSASEIDTTVLVHPHVLGDFLDYNAFLGRADKLLRRMSLEGEIQIASFHPHYQFAGTEPEDIGNYTNRSPYPCLHLLRETSIERAVAAFPDAAAIYERNMEVLERLGLEGWQRWMAQPPDSD